MKTNTTNNMKKIVLLVLLFTGLANAQIVNIPDANFKARLLEANSTNYTASVNTPNLSGSVLAYNTIDTNEDGEIQISEAQVIKCLSIFQSTISDLSGIEVFTNLEYLSCGSNQLTNLNLSGLTNLKYLQFPDNQISSFSFSGLDNLQYLDCSDNLFSSLNLSELINLKYLDCSVNQLSSLDVVNNTALTSLKCGNNQLTILNVNSITFLSDLSCPNNQLTSLNVNNNTLLTNLSCYNNQLTSLNLSNNLKLSRLVCSSNQLTELNIVSNVLLEFVLCVENKITTLDCSKNLLLDYIVFNNNPFLNSLFIKNGKNNFNTSPSFLLSGCPNLTFICADDDETQSLLQSNPSYNGVINSYCSFTPGGNYNTIAGNLKFDSNNNGCDASDLPQPNIRVNMNDGTNTGASFTSTLGNYKFYTQAGSFDIIPEVENPTWFNFTPATATIPFADNNNNNTATQDFCISTNGVHHDLEIVIAPIGVARPGFDAEYQITYSNRGNSNFATGEISLVFNDAILDFIQASNIPISQNPGAINWIFTNLLPFETRTITVTFNVNSPIETPAVNINDVLTYTVNCYPSYFEENVANNQLIYNQTVVGSFDPNNIECLEGTSVAPSEIGKYLHYVINFENTGNFPAENVVVKTIIDPINFDINSLQLLNTSIPVDARITGNVVEFIFKNVQLAGPGGHGHVLLKVKSKNSLIAGDSVANRADIFFDYNAPVDTGLETTVFQSLSNSVFVKDDSVSVSPNPTSGNTYINSIFNIKSIELYDVQGRIIETHIGETKTLDISEKASGIYFLKITTEKGSKIEKLVKD